MMIIFPQNYWDRKDIEKITNVWPRFIYMELMKSVANSLILE